MKTIGNNRLKIDKELLNNLINAQAELIQYYVNNINTDMSIPDGVATELWDHISHLTKSIVNLAESVLK